MSRFDPDQQKAVNFDKGLAIVTAGAGSGKTHTLIGRIDALVAKGVPAERILAVTFTNAAANEMKDRLSPAAKSVRACTIHSEALLVTKAYLGKRFNAKRFGGSVLSDKESRTLLSYIMQPVSKFNPIGSDIMEDHTDLTFKNLKTYAATISRWKDSLMSPDDAARNPENDPAIVDLYRLYEDRKSKGYRHPQTRLPGQVTIDFGDMLMLAIKAFRESPAILKDWQGRYDYVMCDEAQDCNMAQYAFLRYIADTSRGGHGNLMFIGDDWQSIYRFRGAAPYEFIKTAKDATVLTMGRNYRSRAAIVALGERLISHNKDQLAKTVSAVRD